MKLLREVTGNAGDFAATVGGVTLFLGRILGQTPRALLRPSLIIEQVHNTGALSLVIIMTCGLFVGAVLGLQGYNLLLRFGSEDALGTAAALALIRELGPVVTALLFSGRAGTALASEIGLMRATDQLTAMEMMAVDPIRRVVAPRFIGGVIAMPLLTLIFIAIGIFGVQVVGVQMFGVDSANFWSQMRSSVALDDIAEGAIKGVVFGFACSLIAVYEGYTAVPTAEGVGRATTRTVVISAVLTLMLDYMLTAVML
ncbi:lipid asymmetry maintenance ABC transporter permease subunit MlaE [Steroidobacter sp. S1-65]|uniref:Intermembrane phospholipid transport system permease protein MlaE n=1 Tax=Steroidobacter gossypii TaxID=2805490 RepID=A0ABS1X1I1_9GAMM|nr:lipid asymmetry maintenance ABC transporter permease subunit MlaE [Steroidobacter gossypii]MBM0107074.1 lipid asymmetry maintenance ABC transporter permease subunit MlaE [Steroidobacter gossypii]